VKRIYKIKFRHIDKVYSYKLTDVNVYWVLRIAICKSIYGIELILTVKVGIKAVDNHNEFLSRGSRSPGVYDKCAVESFFYVFFYRHNMTVVEKKSEGVCSKLVCKASTSWNNLKHTIHISRMYAMEVDCMSHVGCIYKVYF